jgi:hypothetical protein
MEAALVLGLTFPQYIWSASLAALTRERRRPTDVELPAHVQPDRLVAGTASTGVDLRRYEGAGVRPTGTVDSPRGPGPKRFRYRLGRRQSKVEPRLSPWVRSAQK